VSAGLLGRREGTCIFFGCRILGYVSMCHEKVQKPATRHRFARVSCPQANAKAKSSIFLETTSCSPLKFNRCFGGTGNLHIHGRRISQEINQHEAGSKQMQICTCSTETSNDFQWITRCYIPEDRTLHNYRCDNLKSYEYLNDSQLHASKAASQFKVHPICLKKLIYPLRELYPYSGFNSRRLSLQGKKKNKVSIFMPDVLSITYRSFCITAALGCGFQAVLASFLGQ
jgi:hypothetical protein